jgi:SAM-dependent methyltransferase
MDTLPSIEPAYDAFAWFYNRYWNERFHQSAFPVFERLFLARLPAAARVLDVCCGTGYLARLLVSRGLRVTGIDLSPEMVRYARRNVPEAEFQVADGRDFRFRACFHGAISTFDSLNHILTLPELECVFRNVSRALIRGGLFAFDILLEDACRAAWAGDFALVRDDHMLAVTGGRFDKTSRLARSRLTMFRRCRGRWLRSDAVVTEKCYTAEEIVRGLESVGFGAVTLYDARDLDIEPELGAGRMFVTARRDAAARKPRRLLCR